jgi:hypothetical protein
MQVNLVGLRSHEVLACRKLWDRWFTAYSARGIQRFGCLDWAEVPLVGTDGSVVNGTSGATTSLKQRADDRFCGVCVLYENPNWQRIGRQQQQAWPTLPHMRKALIAGFATAPSPPSSAGYVFVMFPCYVGWWCLRKSYWCGSLLSRFLSDLMSLFTCLHGCKVDVSYLKTVLSAPTFCRIWNTQLLRDD